MFLPLTLAFSRHSQLQRTWAQDKEVVVEAEEIEEGVVERREASVRMRVTNLSGREKRVEVSTVSSENVVWLVCTCFEFSLTA